MAHPKNWHRVRDLLHELGDTPEAIRDTLLLAGITGQPRVTTACPVARYVARTMVPVTGSVYKVETRPAETQVFMAWWQTPDHQPRTRVGRDGHEYYSALDYQVGYLEPHTHSNALREFIRRFDNGEFPELIEHPLTQKAE